MDLDRTPGQIAYAAAEEVRTLNHRTLGLDRIAFENPPEIGATVEGLLALTDRLGQSLQQLRAGLQQFDEQQAIRMDDGSDPASAATKALRDLLNAEQGLGVMRASLRSAGEAVSHMGGHFAPEDEEDSAVV
ncbi:hypothetical protein [Streptomyces olivaceiscleroticus]|uniref:Uncharacterized protein n=1 Tax=Streptomyces olivaceiscleroticus TaxID=68245 RepID=A0ABN1BMC4_9ACTN